MLDPLLWGVFALPNNESNRPNLLLLLNFGAPNQSLLVVSSNNRGTEARSIIKGDINIKEDTSPFVRISCNIRVFRNLRLHKLIQLVSEQEDNCLTHEAILFTERERSETRPPITVGFVCSGAIFLK